LEDTPFVDVRDILAAGILDSESTDDWLTLSESVTPAGYTVRFFFKPPHRTTRGVRVALRLRTGDCSYPFDFVVDIVGVGRGLGGLEWVFACPLRGGSIRCCHNTRRLYLSPTFPALACRECANLIYHSAKTHKSRTSCWRKTPDRADTAIRDYNLYLSGDAPVPPVSVAELESLIRSFRAVNRRGHGGSRRQRSQTYEVP